MTFRGEARRTQLREVVESLGLHSATSLQTLEQKEIPEDQWAHAPRGNDRSVRLSAGFFVPFGIKGLGILTENLVLILLSYGQPGVGPATRYSLGSGLPSCLDSLLALSFHRWEVCCRFEEAWGFSKAPSDVFLITACLRLS